MSKISVNRHRSKQLSLTNSKITKGLMGFRVPQTLGKVGTSKASGQACRLQCDLRMGSLEDTEDGIANSNICKCMHDVHMVE